MSGKLVGIESSIWRGTSHICNGATFRDGNMMERTDAHWKGIQENWGQGEYTRRKVKYHHTDLLEIILEDWITR